MTKRIILVTAGLIGWLAPAVARELHQAVKRLFGPPLMRGLDIAKQDRVLGTPLHVAALTGDATLAELLIANGADVNAKIRSDAMTPLHMAARNGDAAVIELLIANGADIEARDRPDGSTPLHWAARSGNLGAADLLLRSGADVNADSTQGFKPLHDAAWKNQAEMIELLVSRGADVDAASTGFLTPLYTAAKYNQLDAAARLLDLGADPNGPRDMISPSPLRQAMVTGHNDIAELLRRARGHGARLLAPSALATRPRVRTHR